jgi:hypothetical protein
MNGFILKALSMFSDVCVLIVGKPKVAAQLATESCCGLLALDSGWTPRMDKAIMENKLENRKRMRSSVKQ